MENIVGSILQIRPIIEVKQDGTLDVKSKCRGSRNKALNKILSDFEKNKPNIVYDRVFITYSGCENDAMYLANEINNIVDINELSITTAGSTIGSHCGSNTIGILYIQK